jgi:hypothetical protein
VLQRGVAIKPNMFLAVQSVLVFANFANLMRGSFSFIQCLNLQEKLLKDVLAVIFNLVRIIIIAHCIYLFFYGFDKFVWIAF